ncbi:MAG TPA: hypothetical protein VHW43_10820, partial [Puia sp.]|nr:hypothetical protein [Puia sp.]
MHQPLIIQHLFQVSTLEDVSRERLESFVESYPSYGIGHYLLSCKLQAEGSDRFLPETQRTCLYFSNPLWLQWLLQNSDASVATQPVGSGSPAETVVESVALESVTSFSEEATYVEASTETTYAEAPIADTPVETPESPVENVVTMAEEAFGGPATGDDLAEALTASGATSNGEGLSAAEQLLRSIEEAKELRESLQKLQADSTAETSIAGESLPAETEAMAEPAAEPVAIAETPVEHETIAPPEEPVAAPEPTAPQEEPIHDEEVPYVLEEREERPAAEEVVAAVETPAEAE